MGENKKKIVTIVGARPQIIKASVISRAIAQYFSDFMEEVIVHTGQHYAENISDIFFKELNIPEPAYNIRVGSGTHGSQTAQMIKGIEEILFKEKPDAVILYGDTNTTISGAIAGSKIGIPIIHIEAGLRSFNKKMPEEINRITCDHMSSLLFVPTSAGIENLSKEGFNIKNKGTASIDSPNIYHCGDIMYDNSQFIENHPQIESTILNDYNLKEGGYILFTIHRANNTDKSENLLNILSALVDAQYKTGLKIILPLHPRTRNKIDEHKNETIVNALFNNPNIHVIDAIGVFDITELERKARIIATDSGGIQKEAYFFKKPCVVLREETEWIEMLETGSTILTGADREKILLSIEQLLCNDSLSFPPIFGDGNAGKFICSKILSDL